MLISSKTNKPTCFFCICCISKASSKRKELCRPNIRKSKDLRPSNLHHQHKIYPTILKLAYLRYRAAKRIGFQNTFSQHLIIKFPTFNFLTQQIMPAIQTDIKIHRLVFRKPQQSSITFYGKGILIPIYIQKFVNCLGARCLKIRYIFMQVKFKINYLKSLNN